MNNKNEISNKTDSDSSDTTDSEEVNFRSLILHILTAIHLTVRRQNHHLKAVAVLVTMIRQTRRRHLRHNNSVLCGEVFLKKYSENFFHLISNTAIFYTVPIREVFE